MKLVMVEVTGRVTVEIRVLVRVIVETMGFALVVLRNCAVEIETLLAGAVVVASRTLVSTRSTVTVSRTAWDELPAVAVT